MEQNDTLYRVVYENIKNDILQMKYKKGEQLPSLKELSLQYDVGRNTVRSAIHLLEKIGFIKPSKGSNHIVIYDMEEFGYNLAYRTMAVSKAKAIHEILEILGFIMPQIVEEALLKSTPADIEEMERIVDYIEHDEEDNPNVLFQQLMELYTLVFASLHNAKLSNLFQSMMQFILIPLNSKEMNSPTSRYFLKKFRGLIMRSFKKVLKGKTSLLKTTLPLFTSLVDKGCQQFCRDYCMDLKEVEPIAFQWATKPEQRYLYMRICVEILFDINHKHYQKGDKLPSIEELTKLYKASKNTVLKAIEELNEYNIIRSINGVGSIIICDDDFDFRKFLAHPHLQIDINNHRELLKLSWWIIASFRKKDLSNITPNACRQAHQELTTLFTLHPLMKMFCDSYNETLAYINEQISKSFVWQVFLRISKQGEFQKVYSIERRDAILHALEVKDFVTIQKVLLQMLEGWYNLLEKLSEYTLEQNV